MKIRADVVESYLAALTLDQGLDRTERFLEEHLFPRLKVRSGNCFVRLWTPEMRPPLQSGWTP